MKNGGRASRRSFLKMGVAAAIAPAMNQREAAAQPAREPGRPQTAHGPIHPRPLPRRVDLVNPLQGTDSTPLFSRGNTLPIVALPFGMAHWTPQSSNADAWFFQPRDQRLQGVRCTHQLSPWVGDYGHATFLPFSGDALPEPSERASSYRAQTLSIRPNLFSAQLTRYRCRFELAPTERCAAMRLTFDESGQAGVMIDLPGADAEAHLDASTGTVTALTRANSGGVPAGFAAYYRIEASAPGLRLEVADLKDRRVAILRFTAQAGKPVLLGVATSFISFDQAARNLAQEIGQSSFDQVEHRGAAVWEEALGRVRIDGGSERQQRIFYSALYRCLLFPRIWHEQDAAGNLVHFSAYSGKVEPGPMYADHGYWDTYRAWYPMMALLYPERLTQILEGWVNAYKEGGWLPQFPCPGYRGLMTGSPLDFVFGDAVAKGIKGFDLDAAYRGLRKHATQAVAPGLGYGRPAVDEYERLGYIPCEQVVGAVAESLDSAFGDFCIAQVARAAGHAEDAARFEARSRNWRKIFDPATRFFRGRLANGAWAEPFDPHTWGGPYVEGGAWQYRFFVPHDPQGLMDAMGGQSAFVAALEQMLSQPPAFHVGSYGREIHEMSEMAAVDFGQYAHSNQPVHHALYMFSAAGRRDRTQYWVHRVLNELYTPEDLCGDEDTGSMSAWYVLSALGIFSLCPGKPEWMLGAPLFERASIAIADGGRIEIEARGLQHGRFLNHVTLNGAEVRGNSVLHSDLMKGARLVFESV